MSTGDHIAYALGVLLMLWLLWTLALGVVDWLLEVTKFIGT